MRTTIAKGKFNFVVNNSQNVMLRFKGLFFTLVSLISFSATSHAQVLEPVSWELGVENNTEEGATLVFKAAIDEGWHVYATVTSDDEKALLEGPLPTVLTVEENPNYELVGELQDTEFETHMEKVWGFELNFYDGTAEFRQDVKWNSEEPFFIKGDLSYMACNDEKCIFPDPVVFNFGINGATEEKASTGILDPVSWSVASKDLGNGNYEIALTGVCEEGWHYYATKLENNEGPLPSWFQFKNEGVYETVGELNEPKPHKAYDPNFAMELLFHDNATFTQRIKLSGDDSQAEGIINYMVCNDEKCLPPKDVFWKIDVKTGVGSFLSETAMLDNEGSESTSFEEGKDPFVINTVDLNNPLNECTESEGSGTSDEKEENSLWMTFLLGIGGGLLALLTPCVFPMIPLTVSFFTKGSEKGNGKARAALYGFFILMIYLLLSLPFHLSKNIDPEILNQISTHPGTHASYCILLMHWTSAWWGNR